MRIQEFLEGYFNIAIQYRAFFHNLAYISGESDRSDFHENFTVDHRGILGQGKGPLYVGSNLDPESVSGY